jgi:methylmalonic aciduria homocystinuria type C protein
VSQTPWQDIVIRVDAAAADAGFDLVQPFRMSAASQAASHFGLARENALGLLIGNTRRLWPIFTQACRDDRGLAARPAPLDAYVTERLTQVAADVTPRAAALAFAHVTTPRPFPIQRVAEQAGLAALAPCHLVIHPVHGPWIALRAVMVFDVDGPDGAPAPLERPCQGCPAPCVTALERALSVSGSPLTSAAIAAHARDWIAVRDACPVGRASRYSDAQLSYHYAPSNEKLIQGS